MQKLTLSKELLAATLVLVLLALCTAILMNHGEAQAHMSQAVTTVISDTTFAATDWSVQVKSESGASQTSKQEFSGGNPDAFRSMEHILPRPAGSDLAVIEVTHIFAGQSYNPRTQGAIDKIDYSEDTALLSLPWPQAYVASYLIVKQDYRIYRSTNFIFISGTSWETGALTNLTADDFFTLDGSGRKPDFSDSGSLIEFGYWRGSNRTNDSPVPEDRTIVLEHGIDNFIVMIHHQAHVNRPPIARNDVYAMDANNPLRLPETLEVTSNDFDPDGDFLTISEIRPPGVASIWLQTDIRYDYPPNAPYYIKLFYTVTDGEFFDDAKVTLLKDCGCVTSCTSYLIKLTHGEAQADTVDLGLLYRVRDELLKPTEHGARYVDIYYNTTPELLKVLLIDRPDLGARAVDMVEMLQPVLRNMLHGDGSMPITQAQMDTVATVFADLAAAGSDTLLQVIAEELDRLGELDNYVGKSVAEVMSTVLGDSILTSIDDYSGTEPVDFVLQQNFPNPFNPSTQISYNIPEATHVILAIYNVLGQQIQTLVDELQTAGKKSVVWHGLDHQGIEMTSGVYIYHLRAGTFRETKKMLLLR